MLTSLVLFLLICPRAVSADTGVGAAGLVVIIIFFLGISISLLAGVILPRIAIVNKILFHKKFVYFIIFILLIELGYLGYLYKTDDPYRSVPADQLLSFDKAYFLQQSQLSVEKFYENISIPFVRFDQLDTTLLMFTAPFLLSLVIIIIFAIKVCVENLLAWVSPAIDHFPRNFWDALRGSMTVRGSFVIIVLFTVSFFMKTLPRMPDYLLFNLGICGGIYSNDIESVCWYKKAVAHKDISFCRAHLEYNACMLRLAVRAWDIDICSNELSREDQESCRAGYYLIKAVRDNDRKVCEIIKEGSELTKEMNAEKQEYFERCNNLIIRKSKEL